MDYKYIEQLLERYWECETTIEEENILRAFFSQEELPKSLLKYRSLFAYEKEAAEKNVLGNDFDSKILAMVEDQEKESTKTVRMTPLRVKAHTVTMRDRLMPLFKAAAVVAIIVTLGNAAQFSFNTDNSQEDEINYANYKDTYTDPSRAYDKVENALELISQGINQAETDSIGDLSNPAAHNGVNGIDNDSTKKE